MPVSSEHGAFFSLPVLVATGIALSLVLTGTAVCQTIPMAYGSMSSVACPDNDIPLSVHLPEDESVVTNPTISGMKKSGTSVIIEPVPTTVYTATNPPPRKDNNYTLRGNDVWLIEDDTTFNGNVTLLEESSLVIRGCRVIFYNGTVWGRNYTKAIFENANVTFNVWSVGVVNKSMQYANPNGFILMEDSTELTVRDSTVHITRKDPFSINPPGMERVEQVYILFGKVAITNSTIDTRGLRQNIPNGTFVTVERVGTMHGNSVFSISDSKLYGFICYVNAYGRIDRSNMTTLAVDENTGLLNVFVFNSTIRSMSAIWDSGAALYNSRLLSPVSVQNDAELYILGGSLVIDKYPGIRSTVYNNARLYIHDSTLSDGLTLWNSSRVVLQNSKTTGTDTIDMHQASDLSIQNNSWTYRIDLWEWSNLSMVNASVDYLTAADNTSIRLRNATINMVTDYQTCLDDYATIYIDTVFVVVTATVNGRYMPLYMDCFDEQGNLVAHTVTNRPAQFGVTKQIIRKSDIVANAYCIVSVYRGKLEQAKRIDLVSAGELVTINIPLTDSEAPKIESLSWEPFRMIGTTGVLVRAKISDAGIGVEKAVVRYTVNGGNMTQSDMLYLGEDLYETTIPGQKAGAKIALEVVASDFCGNNLTSSKGKVDIPDNSPAIGWTIFIIMVVTVALVAVIILRRRRVRLGYLKKRK